MLLKQQLKGIIKVKKVVENEINCIFDNNNTLNATKTPNQNSSLKSATEIDNTHTLSEFKSKSLQVEKPNSPDEYTPSTEVASLIDLELNLDSDDDDELILRYKALKSAMKALDEASQNNDESELFLSGSNASDDINNIDQILNSNKQLEKDVWDALKKSFPSDEDSNSSFTTYLANNRRKSSDLGTPCDSNKDLVDMDICSSDNNENSDKENFETSLTIPNLSNNSPDNENLTIPVKWAYMIPPPPSNGPVNNLNDLKTWCYDQNLCVQTMQESHKRQFEESCNNVTINYSAGNHCKNEYPPITITTENKVNNEVFNVNNMNELNDDEINLKDRYAKPYEAFMSSIIKQSQNSLKEQTNCNLIQVKITPEKVTSKRKKLTKKQRMRRKRLLKKAHENNKQKEEEQVLSDTNIQEKENSITDSFMKSNIKEDYNEEVKVNSDNEKQSQNNSGLISTLNSQKDTSVNKTKVEDDDVDIDVLRAQLLIDLSNKRHKINNTSNFENNRSINQLSLVSSTEKVFDTKSAVTTITTPLDFIQKRQQINQLKQVAVTSSSSECIRPSYHGKAIENRLWNSSYGLENCSFKFPPVKPVIINLNSDSDSSENEMENNEEANQTCNTISSYKNLDNYISGNCDQSLQTNSSTTSLECLPFSELGGISGKLTDKKFPLVNNLEHVITEKSKIINNVRLKHKSPRTARKVIYNTKYNYNFLSVFLIIERA